MGVPASSGQLRLRADINQEVNGNDTDTNVSLGTLSEMKQGLTRQPDQYVRILWIYCMCST